MKRVFEAHPLKSVRVKGSALHEMLSGLLFFQLLQVEFMKVKSTSDEHNLQFCLFKPSSSESVIGTVPLHFTKCTFGLNTAIHTKQRTVNTIQIIQDLLMEAG